MSGFEFEFLRYPQFIRHLFNGGWVGPPMEFYFHFNLTMGRSPGFQAHYMQLNALFKLAFASASVLKTLTLLHIIGPWCFRGKVPYHTFDVL